MLAHKSENNYFLPLLNKTFKISSTLFWMMHSLYWFAFALTSYLTLNLWYGTGQFSDLAHTLIQSIIGFFLVLPLHQIYTSIWYRSKFFRLVSIISMVVLFSAIWTFIRMQLFISMTNADSDLWYDLGGWYFSSFFVFLGWTILYHFVFYYDLANQEYKKNIATSAQAKVEKLKRLEAEKQASDARLQMLRYQVTPHFLFNTLNSISALITVKETDNAKLMLDQLGSFLRYSLEDNTTDSIPLSRELEGLKLYIGIEEIRFSDRLKVSFNCSENALDVKVPCMILQPIVENALKYGVSQTEVDARLEINAVIKDGNLQLSVIDNGPGSEGLESNLETFKLFSGVGLRNIENRLKNIYGKRYKVNLSNLFSGGLRVDMSLPATF